MSIGDTVYLIKELIDKIITINGLRSNSAVLLGASKGQPYEKIEEAIKAGVTSFGENRVQEAEAKWPSIRERHAGLSLHLIGPLQTNKVKQALALFDVIQTIDRVKLADAIAQAAPGDHHRFFIQVNIGKEPQKAGVLPEDTASLIEHCRDTLKLRVVGLMCVPPHDKPAAPYFAMLGIMARQHGLTELSMGMSEDYETAIRMGSTCIRLGRGLFGERS
jgi:PLP dependent protein